MLPYRVNHHFSYFQCCCHPGSTPSLSYPQAYQPQFQTQLQMKKPLKSPHSIESLLEGKTTDYELAAFDSPSAKQDTPATMADKLKALEDQTRSNRTSVLYKSREKPTAGTCTEMHSKSSSYLSFLHA